MNKDRNKIINKYIEFIKDELQEAIEVNGVFDPCGNMEKYINKDQDQELKKLLVALIEELK